MGRKKTSQDLEGQTNFIEDLDEDIIEGLVDDVNEAGENSDDLEEKKVILEEIKTTPKPGDDSWTDYVMSKLKDKEKVKDKKTGKENPTTGGLRRVAEELLGEILESSSIVIQAPSPLNEYRACVQHKLVVLWKFDEDGSAPTRIITEAADACPANTDDPYSAYPTAIAATRAEGRALRKALRLHQVIAAEEVAMVIDESVLGKGGKINTTQINAIDMQCMKLNIDVIKFINMGEHKYDDINEVPRKIAEEMCKRLNLYQRGEKAIPQKIVGYDDNWNN